jgi:PEP-CTERM motif-containing protein
MAKSFLHAAVAAFVICAGSTALAATNLVTNGDFSSPTFAPGHWSLLTSPFMGWSGADGVIEIGQSDVYGLPCDNAVCQNLEVNDIGADVDTFTVTGLTIGKKYVFSYAYGGRAGNPQTLIVSDTTGYSNTISGQVGFWTTYSTDITATGTFDTLIFDGLGGGRGGCASCGNEITNVSFSAVPEPSTWAMLCLGFAGVGLFGFAKRRREPRYGL